MSYDGIKITKLPTMKQRMPTTIPNRATFDEAAADCYLTMFEATVARVSRLKVETVPHCDCVEANRIAGFQVERMIKRDEPGEMCLTTLNSRGNCTHCNYTPFYKEIETNV